MAQYIIESPIVADAEALTAMHGQSWLDAYPSEGHGVSRSYIEKIVERRGSSEGIAKRRGYIQENGENPNYYFRIARDTKGTIVGFIDGRRGEAENELNGLYIDKKEYGKGLAQQLWEGFHEWAGDDRDISLSVVSYNDRAQGFYRKIGFEIVPGTEKKWNDEIMPIVDMIRPAKREDKLKQGGAS